jgi:hypothetical protein
MKESIALNAEETQELDGTEPMEDYSLVEDFLASTSEPAKRMRMPYIESGDSPLYSVKSFGGNDVKIRIFVQYAGRESEITRIGQQCMAAWREEHPGKIIAAESCAVYVKPEEGKAYWVINDTDAGAAEL